MNLHSTRKAARPARRRLVQILCAASMLLAGTSCGWARDLYRWSPNVAIAPYQASRQQGETALAADSSGRVWLTFIDAEYTKTRTNLWIAFPRTVRLFMSTDAGRSFSDQSRLSNDSAGDEALTVDSTGKVYASFVNYFPPPAAGLVHQQIVVRRLDAAQEPYAGCLPWDADTKHDQSSIHAGRNDTLHVVGSDIRATPNPAGSLLYAHSTDGGRTCTGQRRVPSVGELPQIVDTQFGLLIAGPEGYYTSADNGASFSAKVSRRFGSKVARLAVSPDRRMVYVVGDATAGGLRIQVSPDGGRTWRITRVDDAPRATAWRYPAVHVDRNGRVHVVWMDDRSGFGAIYHAYSDDAGASFSPSTRVSDQQFVFPANAPEPPPATQNGTWIGDYLSLTTANGQVIVAWSDQRAGAPKSVVQIATGSPDTKPPAPPSVPR